MRSRYWEKLWHEIIDDIKLGPLPGELKWRFVQLIVVAGMTGEDGLLPELPDLAFRLRLSEEQLRSDLPTLARRELVELTPNNRWLLSNYTKRQAAISPTERSRLRRSSSASASSASSFKEKDKDTDTEAEADKCNDSLHFRCTVDVATILRDAGISRNRTTAILWDLSPDYVRAHLENEPKTGLAIRRMLDGDPPPRVKENRLGDNWKDVIQR